MSGIDFTTRDGSASVRGAERAYGAALAARLAAAVLELDSQHTQESNRRILPDIFFRQAEFNAQMHGRAASLTDTFTYWAPMAGMMYEDGSADIRIGDKTERPDGFVINTAVVAGSDPIALLTRIHAYSEEGLLVTGPDRSWLAGIIDAGLQAHILRDKPGWGGRRRTTPVGQSQPRAHHQQSRRVRFLAARRCSRLLRRRPKRPRALGR